MSVQVNLLKAGLQIKETHPTGEYAIPSDDGNWLNIWDEDGNVLAVYPKDNIISVNVTKAGELNMNGDNT